MARPKSDRPTYCLHRQSGRAYVTIDGAQRLLPGDYNSVESRAECKKGRFERSAGNPENKLIHEAIGQLMTIEEYAETDVLLVAVPGGASQRAKLVWQHRPLMEKVGISLVLVGRDGTVEGLPNLEQ